MYTFKEKKVEAKITEEQSIDNRRIAEASWIPWVTALIIALCYVLSLVNNGALTWAFNSVVYGNPAGWGFYFTVGCVILVFLLTKYQTQLASWQPSSQVQWVILFLITGIFITAIIWIRPLYPHMEGDGGLDGGRLRDYISSYTALRLAISDVSAMQICWKSIGVIYILFSLYFVVQVTDCFWDRVLGLIYFTCLPPVINFIGYIDFYGDFFTVAAMFLGFLYLFYKKPSPWILAATFLSFVLCEISHYRFDTLLVFPGFWICLWGMERFKLSHTLRSLIIGFMILGMISLTVILVYKTPHTSIHSFGFMFREIANYDGILIALYHPLLLMISFLFSYFIFLIMYVFVERGRIFTLFQPLTGSIFYGMLGMFLSYYFGQLLSQITTFEILDFIAQAGCLGALFAVPMFVLFMETPWKKWFYCFVLLNLFITIPNFVVHGGHGVEQRLMNNFKDERSVTGWEMSPYVHVGIHFNADHADGLACKVLELGTQDNGYYKRFIPVSLYFLISYEYEGGNRKKGIVDLEKLLQDYPSYCLVLLQGEHKLQNYQADSNKIQDMKLIAGLFFEQTKNPLYSQIIDLCDKMTITPRVNSVPAMHN